MSIPNKISFPGCGRFVLLLMILLLIILPWNVSAFTPLSDLCTINRQNWTLYNRLSNVSELITTTKEIDHGLPEEYNITLTAVYYESYGTISQLDFEIQGNEFPTPVTISSYNYGNFTNLSSGQIWTGIVFYEDNSCPTFDMDIEFFVTDIESEWNQKVRWNLVVNHYKYNLTFIPSPTPTSSPTPSPTSTSSPIIIPNATPIVIPTIIPDPTGMPYDTSVPDNLSGNGSTLDEGTNYMGRISSNKMGNITGISNNISGQISAYNYSTSKSVFTLFLPGIFNMIPAKLWLLIILGWLLEISLIIIKR